AGRRVDEETQPAKRRFSLEPGHEVVRERDALERRAEDELARMEDEGLRVLDLDELGQPLLLGLHVDVRVPRVPEHPEQAVDAAVEARRLHELRVVRVDNAPTRARGNASA